MNSSATGLGLSLEEVREDVICALRMIFDPEIPVNIYDLGLIYDVTITDEYQADVLMTLTAPGCPVAQTFPGEIEKRVGKVDGVSKAVVTLVWEPAWTKDLMSEAAQLQLGML